MRSESAQYRHICSVFHPVEALRSLKRLGRSCQNSQNYFVSIPILFSYLKPRDVLFSIR